MSLATSALIGLKLLTPEVEAKDRIPNVDAAALMEHCNATSDSTNRKDVRGMVGNFNDGLEAALEAPTQAQLRRGLAYALHNALTQTQGTKKALVTVEEIEAQLLATEATLADKVKDKDTVAPNRTELRDLRVVTAENDALLDLVLTVEGRPLKLRDLLEKYKGDYEALYRYVKVTDFTTTFELTYKLDCEDASVHALNNGGAFPEHTKVAAKAKAPEWKIEVNPDPLAPLPPQPWRFDLGEEAKEFDETWLMVDEQRARADRGLDRFENRSCLDNYKGTKVVPQVEIIVD